MKRLQKLRESSTKLRNKGRHEAKFFVGDYVLVDRSRWPQRKLKKIESQFFGPYRILEVRHNSLKVAVSPSMGGVAICSFSQVKHWKSIIDHDEEFLDDKDFQPDDPGSESDSENVVQGPPENQVKNIKEDLPPGYFLVSKILRHKFDQGWKFLTAWEGFPITSATWEPPKNFKVGGDKWNSIFEEYCKSHDIPFPPGRRRILVARYDENCCDFSPQEENGFSKNVRARAEFDNGKTLESGESFACQGRESKREVRHQATSDRACSWSGEGQPLTNHQP